LVRPDLVDPDQDRNIPEDNERLRDCMTRTAKHRAVDWDGKPIFKGHEAQSHDLQITSAEDSVLKALSRFVQEDMVINTSDQAEALVRAMANHTYQKIATSSWAALLVSLRARLSGIQREDEAFDDSSSGEIRNFDVLPDDEEQIALRKLIDRVAALPRDSKLDYFLKLVMVTPSFRQPCEKVLVFTQYRETQEFLKEQLQGRGQTVALIHGGLNLDERTRQREYFEDTADILISTEAGSEGANLQRKCHLMVNYDLSWNPMRMLQRIGRLDRFGQTCRVKVVNIRLPQAWDSVITDKILAKLAVTGHTLGRIAEEDFESMIIGEIFESIDVGAMMSRCQWGGNDELLDTLIGEEVERVLRNESRFKRLCESALGMPETFTAHGAEISPDDFRDAFAWAADGHGIKLKETRTSENAYLKGVYHFTLPGAFRSGLRVRASPECYLVFDRDRYAEVRGEVLCRVRGQEIKPELAGLGDPVTDWFFRSALSATPSGSIFALDRPDDLPERETWWIAWFASWKRVDSWRGPETIHLTALDETGKFTRMVPPLEIMERMRSCRSSNQLSSLSLPDDSAARNAVRAKLKSLLPSDGSIARSLLSLVPWIAVKWEKG